MVTSEPPPSVTLVIPGRNCAKTLRRCLESTVPLLTCGQLKEIIFVDDGSTDDTAAIASEYPIRIVPGHGRGAASARNVGWRVATTALIWFIDSDCVAEPDTLAKLMEHMTAPNVAAVGGSYLNIYPNRLLPTLIHEEIVSRHSQMPTAVDFLATFNVLYRRDILEMTDGFAENFTVAEDAELAFRIRELGYDLRFERTSRVWHHHPTNLFRYLKTQAVNGYFRVMLYRLHPGKVGGDSYAGLADYIQPPLAIAAIACTPLAIMYPWTLIITFCLVSLAILAQLPRTLTLIKSAGPRLVFYPLFGFIRAIARGTGLVIGLAATLAVPYFCVPTASKSSS